MTSRKVSSKYNTGGLPESLTQGPLVGKLLAGGLGVCLFRRCQISRSSLFLGIFRGPLLRTLSRKTLSGWTGRACYQSRKIYYILYNTIIYIYIYT